MPFGKKYRKAVEGLDLSQRFSVEEAVEKSLGASFAKFDETVDVAIGLGVDPKYSDQMVRGAVSLPHGLGKTVRVAVFCKGEKEAEDVYKRQRLGAADTDGRGRFLFWRCVLAGGAPEEAGSGKNAVGLAATLNSPQVALCFPGLRNSPHEL